MPYHAGLLLPATRCCHHAQLPCSTVPNAQLRVTPARHHQKPHFNRHCHGPTRPRQSRRPLSHLGAPASPPPLAASVGFFREPPAASTGYSACWFAPHRAQQRNRIAMRSLVPPDKHQRHVRPHHAILLVADIHLHLFFLLGDEETPQYPHTSGC